MTIANPPSLPLSRSKSAALSRVIDLVSKGYHFYCLGRCPVERLPALARKLHERYGVACSPAQRMRRKQQGWANAALVVFLPRGACSGSSGSDPEEDSISACLASRPDATEASGKLKAGGELQAPLASPLETPCEDVSRAPSKTPVSRSVRTLEDVIHDFPESVQVEWLMLATSGAGAVHEQESLRAVTGKPRLVFCGYELLRHSVRERAAWTFRRTQEEMADWFALLEAQLKRRRSDEVALSLQWIARQPGFAGVREQSWRSCTSYRRWGMASACFCNRAKAGSHEAPLPDRQSGRVAGQCDFL